MKTQQKTIALLVLFSLAATTSVTSFSVFYALETYKNNSQKILEKEAVSYANKLNEVLAGVESTVNTLTLCVENRVDPLQMNNPEYFKTFSNELDTLVSAFDQNTIRATSLYIRFDPAISYGTAGVFHADTNLDGIMETLTPTDISKYEATDRERVGWFYEPLQSGKAIWMSPYYNANIDIEMVSYISPLIVNHKAIGVLGIDIDFKQLRDITKQRTEAGQVVLVDQQYQFLVHNTYKLQDRLDTIDNGKLTFLTQLMDAQKFGTAFYELENTQKVLGFSRLNNQWIVIVALTEQEAFTEINQVLLILISVNAAIMLLLSIGALFTGKYLNTLILRNSDLELLAADRTQKLSEMNTDLEQTVAELQTQQAEMILLNHQLEESLTQTKLYQDRLIISEKLAALGEIVAGVAHELNTPVGTAITLNSYLKKSMNELKDKYESGTISKNDLETSFVTFKESIDSTGRALDRTSGLIQVFKELVLDKSMLDIKRIILCDLIEDIRSNYNDRLAEHQHHLGIECSRTLEFVSYPTVIHQIINQLIQNSLLHGFEGLTGRTIRIQVEQIDRQVTLLYTDDGKGISEAHINKVFDPFYSTRRQKGSAGLGLHIVYNLVTQTLGGSLTLSSAENEGVEFKIVFNELDL